MVIRMTTATARSFSTKTRKLFAGVLTRKDAVSAPPVLKTTTGEAMIIPNRQHSDTYFQNYATMW